MVQTGKNNLVQNSNTRGTMISNGLKMAVFRPLEIIVTLVLEFWSKLFLPVWTLVINIEKFKSFEPWKVWFLSEYIFFRNGHYITIVNKLRRPWSILGNAKSLIFIHLVNHLWQMTWAEHHGACTLWLLAHWHTLMYIHTYICRYSRYLKSIHQYFCLFGKEVPGSNHDIFSFTF